MQEMLRIGICDDEEVVNSRMEQLMDAYGEKNHIAMEYQYYQSGIKLIESEKISDMDILFLDIDMPELDGIETAYQLNRVKKDCKIIMLTSKVERFKEAFEIGAFRFVTKPIEQQEVFKVMDAVRNRMIGNKQHILLRDAKSYTIRQKDIMYVLIDKSSSYIYTEKYEFRSEESLDWWEKELDERLFFRCHKSYIVNMSKIQMMEKNQIQLVTEERIPIAKRRLKDLECCFMEYDTKYR